MARSRKSTVSLASPSTNSGVVSLVPTKTKKSKKTATSDSTYFSLGIDPGYKETGLVLRRGELILEYALTTDQLGKEAPTAFRSQAIANFVIGRAIVWISSYSIRHLEIGLEMPIYNRNAVSYAKQCSLIQAIEAELCRHVAPLCGQCWLSEFIPSESKHLATGSGRADKAEVLRSSPFATFSAGIDNLGLPVYYYDRDSMETLGDAWAHSLCVDGAVSPRFNLKLYERLYV